MRSSPIPAALLGIIALSMAVFPGGCLCLKSRHYCRICVAEPAGRYCIDYGFKDTEPEASLAAKEMLCEGLEHVKVPDLDTTTSSKCVAAPTERFTSRCREEKWLGGALGGRVR